MRAPARPEVEHRGAQHAGSSVRAAPLVWAALAAALAAPQPAHADEANLLLIGGAQGSAAGSFTYAGAIKPMAGATPGHGGFYKAVASWLTYRYDTRVGGRDTTVRASAPGLEAGAGYAWDDGRFSGDASLAAGVRSVRLSPETDTERSRTRITLIPQVAARLRFTDRFDADALGSYSTALKDRFGRVRVGVDVAGWRSGVETMLAQGPTYRNLSRGLFTGTSVAPGWYVELNAGRTTPRSGADSAFVGISLSALR